MITNRYAALLAPLFLLIVSCADHKDVKPVPDYVPVQTQKDGKWGFMAPDGKLLFADKYESQPSLVLEGAFSVKEGEEYNLYRAAANPEKINAKPLVAVGNYVEGLIPATFPGERISILDSKGDKVAQLMPVDGHELVKSDVAFHNGLLVVTTPDGKFGYVDTKGECVIKPIYDAALPFGGGYAMVAKMTDGNNPSSLRVSIIDTKGKSVLDVKPEYTVVDLDLTHKRLIVNDINGHLGFLSFKDEFTPVPSEVTNIGQVSDGRFVFANEKGLCGVMDDEFKQVLAPEYQHVEILDNDKFLASLGKDFVIVNSGGGEEVKLGAVQYAGFMQGFGIFAYDVNTVRLLSEDGSPKGKPVAAIGLNASACSSVRSDFESAKRIAGDLAALPSGAGVAGIAWGTPAEQIAPAADSATGIYAALPQASLSGVDYILNSVAVYTAPVGAFSAMADGESSEGFAYNPDARLTGADFYFRGEAPITKSFVSQLKNAYTAAGFKEIKQTPAGMKGECFVMQKEQTAVIFCIPVGGYDANFFVCSAADTALGERWYGLLSRAAADGGVPMAEALFGKPAAPEPHVDGEYADRSSRPVAVAGEDSGERVSSR